MRHYTALEKSQEQNYAVSRSHTSNITDDTIHVAKFQVFIFIYVLNIFSAVSGISCPPPTLFRPASLVRYRLCSTRHHLSATDSVQPGITCPHSFLLHNRESTHNEYSHDCCDQRSYRIVKYIIKLEISTLCSKLRHLNRC